jgi:DNA-binding transcriptional ArsR family regulator
MKKMTTDEGSKSGNIGAPVTTELPFYSRYVVQLTEAEQKVLVIAKELMRKHYLLDLKDLYSQAVRFLKDYTPFSVQQAIDGLCRKKVLFGGSALTRDTVLGNETRRVIFDLICQLPGIHFSAIRMDVDKDSRTTMIHLRVLERFEMIRVENYSNNKAYFDFFLPKEHDLFYHYLHKDKVREIYAALLSQPGISLGALVSVFNDSIPHPTLYRKVKILLENNLLSGTYDAGQLVSLSVPPRLVTPLTLMLSKQ